MVGPSIISMVHVLGSREYVFDADDWLQPWVWDCEGNWVGMEGVGERR